MIRKFTFAALLASTIATPVTAQAQDGDVLVMRTSVAKPRQIPPPEPEAPSGPRYYNCDSTPLKKTTTGTVIISTASVDNRQMALDYCRSQEAVYTYARCWFNSIGNTVYLAGSNQQIIYDQDMNPQYNGTLSATFSCHAE